MHVCLSKDPTGGLRSEGPHSRTLPLFLPRQPLPNRLLAPLVIHRVHLTLLAQAAKDDWLMRPKTSGRRVGHFLQWVSPSETRSFSMSLNAFQC